ncbi:ATPase [Streptomyces globosus]|uniref:histidine kinase n=1 Tax=Streptomyces globosus TaxID=68209 RepID=A0A344U314_9ACTN|nr:MULTISPECIES: ATP-binding protein [Streptomyces]AXE25285.1 ATPase [Streptomyces globosus]
MPTPRRQPDAAAPPQSAPRTRRLPRPATVRAKVVSLLMVPVVALLALWGLTTVGTARDIARMSRVQDIDRQIRTPVAAAVTELQAERRAAVRLLAAAAPAGERAADLEKQMRRTDAAVRRLRLGDRHTVAESGGQRTAVAVRLREFVAGAEGLAAVRRDTADRRATPDAAYEAYNRVVDAALGVLGALAGGDRPDLGTEARVLLEFTRAGELLSREDALMAAPGPRTAESVRRLAGLVEARRTLTAVATGDLPAAGQAAWQSAAGSSAYAELTAAEDRALAAEPEPSGGPAKDTVKAAAKQAARETAQQPPAGWDAAYASVSASLRDAEAAAHAAAADRGDPVARSVRGPAGAAVLLGLLAVGAALAISVRIGRGLVVELAALRDTALDIARRRLPHAMERLRAGQDIDIDAEAPPGPTAEGEIAQVGEALATVHRAALGAAAERAELAGGIGGVFVNLARRSQVLVHKQLTLLDSMERRADDPAELGDLFRLDHLTTRMRRHAESLIILSGAAPGRAWRMPVPLSAVVRAAVSEIEEYQRVEVRGLADAAVAGAAVADLTHLLAELIENAAQFSPPHTAVRVSGEPVGAGYVLEVEDRGLGMGRETLDEANRRIAQSGALDLFDSDRLGLFVVSRLAARHGVRVHLRPSPYGGTTAVVLLPQPLLRGAPEEEPAPEPAVPSAAGPGSTGAGGLPEEGAAVGAAPPVLPQPRTGPSVRPPSPCPAAAAAPAASRGGLPRRTRQAGLAPQLRRLPQEPQAAARPAEEAEGPSPEQARDRMAAYRAGWVRGAQEKPARPGGEGDTR